MNHSERFCTLFRCERVDRIPLYYFGTWRETKIRWENEGLKTVTAIDGDAGPQVPGMDPDWETGMWDCHGLVYVHPIGDLEYSVIEETENYIIYRNAFGDVVKDSKRGSTIAHVIEYGLQPTRESWEKYKLFLDSEDPRRRGCIR